MVRSIPLSSTTRNAWKSAGAMFARRERNAMQVQGIANGRPIINLGGSTMNIEGSWNNAPVIAPLLTPAASRDKLGSLMPSNEWLGEGYYWLKGQGRGGANKEKVYVSTAYSHNELMVRANWMNGDVQQNIVGTEYRVVTVGTKVVQVTQRVDTSGQREYRWVGVRSAPTQVREIAKDAARMLGDDKIIIGWDVILSDGESQTAGILEGNSCPGVNEATASRILDAVEGVRYAV